MTVYEKIKRGLEEAIAYEHGEVTAKTARRSLSVAPVKQWSASEIKQIRHTTGMPQSLFADVMGVSPKTVEAWEAGRNKPAGPAASAKKAGLPLQALIGISHSTRS